MTIILFPWQIYRDYGRFCQKRMEQTRSYFPHWSLETTRVAKFLGLDVVWARIRDDEIGQIAGRLLALERLIEINEDLRELRGPKGEATIAHEIGHWVLHINPATRPK